MSTMSIYRKHAEMCLQAAAQLKSDAEKAILLTIAREWQRVAAQVDIDLLTCEVDGHA
jgi:hypothetical protein